ncbi:hypothetical protein V8E54_011717 [Elaphomyces granulatus]
MPALAQGNLRKPLPGVKVLEEMPFDIVLNNWKNQRFPVNALMEVKGFLIANWEITASKSLRVQPCDPDNKDVEELRAKPEYKDFDFPLYEDSCLEVECPWVTFSGTVSAIPDPTGDPRVITVDICAYDGKDATGSIFSNFSIHCVLSGPARWRKTFLPKVGRRTTVTGDVVGTYSVNGHPSLCVVASQVNNAPTKASEPADQTPADPPMTPRGLKRFRSADSPRSSPAKTPRMMPRPRTPVKDDDVGSLGAIVEEIED